MHLALEGEAKRRLTKLFLSPSAVASANVTDLSFRLLNTKVPHSFHRKPRPLEEIVKWKASEFHVFLLYLSLPLLRDYLPPPQFYHFSLFVSAMQLLNSDSISQRDIELSQIMLDTYHRLQSSIHGDAEDTYTVHGLTHLPEQVKKHGPLILHSGFVFKAMISFLKRQFHGTRGIIHQIIENTTTVQNIQYFVNKEITGEPPRAAQLAM